MDLTSPKRKRGIELGGPGIQAKERFASHPRLRFGLVDFGMPHDTTEMYPQTDGFTPGLAPPILPSFCGSKQTADRSQTRLTAEQLVD
jgi:hypothetical protein